MLDCVSVSEPPASAVVALTVCYVLHVSSTYAEFTSRIGNRLKPILISVFVGCYHGSFVLATY